MTDILKGAVGGAWTWLISFVLPATLLVGALGLLLWLQYPDSRLVEKWSGWTNDSRLLVAGFVAVATAMILNGLNNGILRILEGYVGIRQVPTLWRKMRDRHIKKKSELQAALNRANESGAGATLETAFLIEQLMHYPSSDDQVGPTRFGNAVRSFETYGATTFGLDSQTLWQELVSSAPESARSEETSARAYVDLLSNLLFVSATVSLCIAVALLEDPAVAMGFALAGTVVTIPIWYWMAVQAAYQWAGAVRAIVNLGRLELAKGLDLTLPRSRSDEIDMWQNFVWLVREGPIEGEDPLEKFRSTPAP